MALDNLKSTGLKEIGCKFDMAFSKCIMESASFSKTFDPISSLTAVLFKVLISFLDRIYMKNCPSL